MIWLAHPAGFEVMLWAACLLGFFGCLHSGEFTTVPGSQGILQPSDVTVDNRDSRSILHDCSTMAA